MRQGRAKRAEASSKENGNRLSLEDGRMGGEGVRPRIILRSSLVDDVAGAYAVVHLGTVGIDCLLTGTMKFGQAREAGTDHPEARRRVDGAEAVSRGRHTQVLKQVRPVGTV